MSPIASTIPGPIKQITGLYVPVSYGFRGGHPTETFVGQMFENKWSKSIMFTSSNCLLIDTNLHKVT